MKVVLACLRMSALVAAIGNPIASMAQESGPALLLELNAVQPSEKGCRLTFVVTNQLGGSLERASFELALFDGSGIVDRLTVLEFRDMPQDKTKVSRFDLSAIDCGKLSRVLVNEAKDCVGAGIAPTACMQGLKTSTKSTVAFGV